MATRFYLPAYSSWTPAAVSPAFDTNWNVTNGNDQPTWMRRPLYTSTYKFWEGPFGSQAYQPDQGQDTEPVREGTTAAVLDVLGAQFISPPLETPGTIGTGTVKGQVYATESSSAADLRAQMSIRVVSRDGTTVRGTLLGFDTGALGTDEFSVYSTFTNRQFPRGGSTALSSVAASDGDRIVIEIGFRGHEGTATNRDARFRFTAGGLSGDLPEDQTTTTRGYSTWMEFSETFTFETDQPTRTTAIWTEVALSGATYTPRVTAIWVEVATEEFWHGFGTPEIGESDYTDAPPTTPGSGGFIVGADQMKGRGRGTRSRFTINKEGTGTDYRNANDYRNPNDYRS